MLFDRVVVMGLKFHSSDYLGTGMTSFQTSGKVFNAQFCCLVQGVPPVTPTDFVCINLALIQVLVCRDHWMIKLNLIRSGISTFDILAFSLYKYCFDTSIVVFSYATFRAEYFSLFFD